jgi:hypothetical protein
VGNEIGVKFLKSESQLGSPELKSPNVTYLTLSGQNETSRNSLKNSRHKFFDKLSNATSRITLRPSMTFNIQARQSLQNVIWTSSPQQKETQRGTSRLSKGTATADKMGENISLDPIEGTYRQYKL